jgi:hypothetical protein
MPQISQCDSIIWDCSPAGRTGIKRTELISGGHYSQETAVVKVRSHDSPRWGVSPWLKNFGEAAELRTENGSGEVDSGSCPTPPPPPLRETYPTKKKGPDMQRIKRTAMSSTSLKQEQEH